MLNADTKRHIDAARDVLVGVAPNPMTQIDQITYAFSRITIWGAAFIVAIMFYEVVMRYVFFQPTLWVNEMSLWAGGMIYATAGLYAMQQRSHIRIYVLYDMAPLWLRQVFDVISVLCTSIFVFAVLFFFVDVELVCCC